MKLRPLPDQAARLLAAMDAPPRLVAHLTLVHDTACSLIAALDTVWPSLRYDREAVLLGAATHDAGKIAYPEELTQPGHEHETAGVALLRGRGFAEYLARFARTHARWAEETDAQLEDLLVALADGLWRGRRIAELEAALCRRVVARVAEPEWRVYTTLDDIATIIAAAAGERLAWQNRYAI